MADIFSQHRRQNSLLPTLLVSLLAILLFGLSQKSIGQDSQQSAMGKSVAAQSEAPTQSSASGLLHLDRSTVASSRFRDISLESDDWTFRPTVLVRRGTSQGSGTIVASLEGETLILTAAHVIRGHGPITVELHRYNFGIERLPARAGRWPQQARAEQLAEDDSADLAIIRLPRLVALPYVAKLGSDDLDASTADRLTSVGIDLGTKLSGWSTRLVEHVWLALNDSGAERRFLVTAVIPEHGRSGGGLYDKDGKLVGVCVGHAEVIEGRRTGIFSSVENVHDLLRRHDLTSVVDRSEARQARLARSFSSPHSRVFPPLHSAITATEAIAPTP